MADAQRRATRSTQRQKVAQKSTQQKREQRTRTFVERGGFGLVRQLAHELGSRVGPGLRSKSTHMRTAKSFTNEQHGKETWDSCCSGTQTAMHHSAPSQTLAQGRNHRKRSYRRTPITGTENTASAARRAELRRRLTHRQSGHGGSRRAGHVERDTNRPQTTLQEQAVGPNQQPTPQTTDTRVRKAVACYTALQGKSGSQAAQPWQQRKVPAR